VEGCDFVLDSVDWPAHLISRWVSRACFTAEIPYIAMSQQPPTVRVGPLYVPRRTGCFSCQERAYRDEYPLYAELEGARQVLSPSASFGPPCAVVGALAANDAVSWLAGLGKPATLGCWFELDLRTMASVRHPVPRDRDCAVCG